MEPVENHPAEMIAQRLTDLRMSRLDNIIETFTPGDPNLINNVLADMMNLLENLFFVLNMPQDGFVSSTPERLHGDSQEEAPFS